MRGDLDEFEGLRYDGQHDWLKAGYTVWLSRMNTQCTQRGVGRNVACYVTAESQIAANQHQRQ